MNKATTTPPSPGPADKDSAWHHFCEIKLGNGSRKKPGGSSRNQLLAILSPLGQAGANNLVQEFEARWKKETAPSLGA